MDISLAGWSLHRRFQNPQTPLRLLDYPALARREFDIDKVELNSPFFEYADPDRAETSDFRAGYLKELKRSSDDAGVRIVGIAVDSHGDLSSLNAAERRAALNNHRKWFDACAALGCAAFRANSGGTKAAQITTEHTRACSESFAQLADWAQAYAIDVLMENHWGVSADPDRMIAIVEAVNHERFGILADFRNFPPEVDLYSALARIAPHARFVHAKFLSFDDRGEDPHFDTARVMAAFKSAGYRGLFGIEFEGQGDDHEGVIQSRRLLERHAY